MNSSEKTIKKEVILYTGITLLLTYGIGSVIYLFGNFIPIPVMTASMPIPGLVCIALYLIWGNPLFKKGNDLGFKIPKVGFFLVTPPIMFLLVLSTCLISIFLSPEFLLSKEIIVERLSNFISGSNPYLNMLLILLINIFIAPILNFPLFLGEELGWRGFLTPRLLKLTNPTIAFLISGVIWGVWHLFGILSGHNYPGFPILGNLMMILLCIPTGVILHYYFLKSGSIFIPMVAHGAINWSSITLFNYLINPENFDPRIQGPTGIIGIALFWIIGGIYFRKFKKIQFSN